MFTDIIAVIAAIGSVATAIAVFYTRQQLVHAQDQARTNFEDELAREYRQLAHQIPVEALLGDDLDSEKHGQALNEFYWYFDLSNEQIFLRQNKRISLQTWINWCDGIASNLSRIAFKKAWDEVKRRSGKDFAELRRLEESGFKDDPAEWK